MKKVYLCATLLIFAHLIICVSPAKAQEKHAYWDDVQTIMKYDKIYEPPKNPILFVGSSSIRKWTSLQVDFGSYNVMNRGVGGFVTNDLIFYANDLIFKYHPRQIMIYVGENDLPQETATADTVFNRFKNLFSLIRSQLPEVPIGYIALKPSPVRAQFYQKAKKANELISSFLQHEPNAEYIDIFTPMYNGGKGSPELFGSDMLHMNAKGYDLWKKIITPYLLEP